jgi:hypothetical protein
VPDTVEGRAPVPVELLLRLSLELSPGLLKVKELELLRENGLDEVGPNVSLRAIETIDDEGRKKWFGFEDGSESLERSES